NAVVQEVAASDLDRVALGEISDRQPQHVPDETGRADQCHMEAKPGQVVLLQEREARSDRAHGEHAQQKRHAPRIEALDQDLIDENAGESRRCQPWNDEAGARYHREDQRGAGPLQPIDQTTGDALSLPAALEFLRWAEGEHDAGKALVELIRGDQSATECRVVQPRTFRTYAVQDDEVVEVPEDDRGQLQL